MNLPIRLGFFLEHTDVMFPILPWTSYRGVDRGELHASQDAPRSLRGAFANEGIDFEVVYAEVAQMPPFEPEWAGPETSRPLLRRLRALHQQVASRPVGVQLLGYDVSHPLPSFHSFPTLLVCSTAFSKSNRFCR